MYCAMNLLMAIRISLVDLVFQQGNGVSSLESRMCTGFKLLVPCGRFRRACVHL